MLLTIGLVALILWAVGFFVFPVIGAMVHLLLMIAIISIFIHIISRTGGSGDPLP